MALDTFNLCAKVCEICENKEEKERNLIVRKLDFNDCKRSSC